MEAREEGISVGVLRPVSLYPFPTESFRRAAKQARVFAVAEMSMGQMVEDVRLALNGARSVEFYGRCGGNVPSHEELMCVVRTLAQKYLLGAVREKELTHA